FMFVSTFLITALGTFITLRIVEPKLGVYNPKSASENLAGQDQMNQLSKVEKKGLRYAGLTVLLLVILLSLTIIPENGVLRNPETGEILNSPFLRGIVTF